MEKVKLISYNNSFYQNEHKGDNRVPPLNVEIEVLRIDQSGRYVLKGYPYTYHPNDLELIKN